MWLTKNLEATDLADAGLVRIDKAHQVVSDALVAILPEELKRGPGSRNTTGWPGAYYR